MKKSEKSNSVFAFGKDWENNAVIDYHGKDGRYISGFGEAAHYLTKHVMSERGDLDTFIFPIVFLFRHYVELCLKSILLNGKKILNESMNGKPDHNIQKYVEFVLADFLKIVNCESQNPEDILGKTMQTELRNIVEGIFQIDPRNDAFRYPTRMDGSDSLEGVSYINIRNFAEKIKTVDSHLNCIDYFYSMILDARSVVE